MTAHDLHTLLRSAHPPTLIHVLPPEVFAATRIPGSQNACVYEMTFLEQVRALVPDTAAPIVVYGAGEESLDAATAAEKLRAAGYTQVQPFSGGLADWQAAGLNIPSAVKAQLATVESRLVRKVVGRISTRDQGALDTHLRRWLSL